MRTFISSGGIGHPDDDAAAAFKMAEPRPLVDRLEGFSPVPDTQLPSGGPLRTYRDGGRLHIVAGLDRNVHHLEEVLVTISAASPLVDPRPRYGNTYIARVLTGRRQGLALAVTVRVNSRFYLRKRNMPFAGFQAGYLDLWNTRVDLPIDETAGDGVTLGGKPDLVGFIDGAEIQWLTGNELKEAVTLFEAY